MEHQKPKTPREWIFVLALAFALMLGLFRLYHLVPDDLVEPLHHIDMVSEYIKVCLELSILFWVIVHWKKVEEVLRRGVDRLMRKRRIEFLHTGDDFQVPEEKVEGIVIPVSRMEQPEWIIRHLKPRHVGFLYTERSKDFVLNLMKEFSGKVIFNLVADGRDMISDADDPLQSREITKKYLRKFLAMGIPHEKTFVDTTGGKVPM